MQEFIDRIFNEYKVTDYDALMKLQDSYIDKENDLIIKLDSIDNNNKYLKENKFDIVFNFCMSTLKSIDKLNKYNNKNEVKGLSDVIESLEDSLSLANLFIGYSESYQKLLTDQKRLKTRLDNINKKLLSNDLEYFKAKSLFLERSRVISSLNRSEKAIPLSKENISIYLNYLDLGAIYNSFDKSISSFKELVDKQEDKKIKKSLNNYYLELNELLKDDLIEIVSRENDNKEFMREAGITYKDSDAVLIKEDVKEEINEASLYSEFDDEYQEENSVKKDTKLDNIISNQKKLEDGINDIKEKKSRFFNLGNEEKDDITLEVSELAKEVDTKNIEKEEVNEASIVDPIENVVEESKEGLTYDEKVNEESEKIIDQVVEDSDYSHTSFINNSMIDRVSEESKEEDTNNEEKVKENKPNKNLFVDKNLDLSDREVIVEKPHGNTSYEEVSYNKVAEMSNIENHGRLSDDNSSRLKVMNKEIIDLDEFTNLKKKVKLLLSKDTLVKVKEVIREGLLKVANSRLLTPDEYEMKKSKVKDILENSNVLERK